MTARLFDRDAAMRKVRRWSRKILIWSRHRLPPGMRFVVGLLLICGGVLGFLPLLGFWMIPVGVMVASLDVVPLWRRVTGRGPHR